MFQFLTDIPGHLAIEKLVSTGITVTVSIPNGHPRPFSLVITIGFPKKEQGFNS